MKLNMMHIEYVMDCMKTNSVKVRNIKQYLLENISEEKFRELKEEESAQ